MQKKDKNNTTIEGWSADKLGEESSYEGETEIKQRILRGDETKGDPNRRDIAGTVPYAETVQGNIELEETEEKGDRNKV